MYAAFIVLIWHKKRMNVYMHLTKEQLYLLYQMRQLNALALHKRYVIWQMRYSERYSGYYLSHKILKTS